MRRGLDAAKLQRAHRHRMKRRIELTFADQPVIEVNEVAADDVVPVIEPFARRHRYRRGEAWLHGCCSCHFDKHVQVPSNTRGQRSSASFGRSATSGSPHARSLWRSVQVASTKYAR